MNSQRRFFSFTGKDKEAQTIFDKDVVAQPSPPVDADQYNAVPAVGAIAKLAGDKQIVLINEAHHVAQTRLLTLQLLKPLYDSGFRYLAIETLDEAYVVTLNRTGVPTLKSGFYSAEPTLALLIREAKRLGFKLVAYEPTPISEEGQAKNIYERIFIKDPQAKVLVHAGYSHIDKMGDPERVPMAKHLWDYTKIEPFSIDQLTFRERGRPEAEDANYRTLLASLQVQEPSLLMKKDDLSYFVSENDQGRFDVQVISPPEEFIRQRPLLRRDAADLMIYNISDIFCPFDQTCLLQAFRRKENSESLAVPFDQIIFDSVTTANLLLATGVYDLILTDANSKVLKRKVITVEN